MITLKTDAFVVGLLLFLVIATANFSQAQQQRLVQQQIPQLEKKNFINFDKVEAADNELIPHVRKVTPTATRPLLLTQDAEHILIPFPRLVPVQIVKSQSQSQSQPQPQRSAKIMVKPKGKSQQQDAFQQSESSGPPIIEFGAGVAGSPKDRDRPQSRRTHYDGSSKTDASVAAAAAVAVTSKTSNPVAAADSSSQFGFQQQYGGGQQQYGGSGIGVFNPSYSGWNSGSTCATCTSYDYSYRQRCCTVGHTICCTVGQHLRPTPYTNSGSGYGHTGIGILATGTSIGGGGGGYGQYNHQPQSHYGWKDRWGWNNNREKPGTCYRPYHPPNHHWNNQGWNNNHNAGYYFERRGDDVDRDFTPEIGGGYNQYQGGGGGGYGVPRPHYGGGGGGYGHGGGHGSIGILGGNIGNRGFPTPSYDWRYCRRDYDCPGNKKCCGGTCRTPSYVG